MKDYISLVFSNARRVLSQCNTQLRLLYLLNKERALGRIREENDLFLIVKLETVFTRAAPAFDNLFMGCVFNINTVHKTVEKLTSQHFIEVDIHVSSYHRFR